MQKKYFIKLNSGQDMAASTCCVRAILFPQNDGKQNLRRCYKLYFSSWTPQNILVKEKEEGTQ